MSSTKGNENNKSILVVAQCGTARYWWHNFCSPEQKISVLVKKSLSSHRAVGVSVKPKDYVILDWSSLCAILPTHTVAEISEPGILLLVLKSVRSEFRVTAVRLKEHMLQDETKKTTMLHAAELGVLEHIPAVLLPCIESEDTVFYSCIPRSDQDHHRTGSKQVPFESPDKLLTFLLNSDPEKYVFRGQVREYPGPLMPSMFRQRFRPFPNATNQFFPWAGLTYFTSESAKLEKDVLLDYGRQRQSEVGKESNPTGAQTVPESQNLTSFQFYFNQPREELPTDLLLILKGQTLKALTCLFGEKIGCVLGQQYGFTSSLLDVSTAPRVAMFFSTRQAPFYNHVGRLDDLGVVYRWPREKAIISEDLLQPLEKSKFKKITDSFLNFVLRSKGLLLTNENEFFQIKLEEEYACKGLTVLVRNARRALQALALPSGSFEQSRIGRQGAAFLNPILERIDIPCNNISECIKNQTVDTAALIADLITTHHGEALYFLHSQHPPQLGQIDKFHLWPIQEKPDMRIDRVKDGVPSVSLARFTLQDKYLEFFLSFMAPFSPVRLSLLRAVTDGKKFSGQLYLPIGEDDFSLCFPGRTFPAPGFAIHPDEADTIAKRLLLNRQLSEKSFPQTDRFGNLLSGPISFPIRRLVPNEFWEEFRNNFEREAGRLLNGSVTYSHFMY